MTVRVPLSHRGRRALTNAFIAFHLAVLFVWCLPASFALRRPLAERVSRYVVGLGLWQGWDMFSPNPRTTNIRVGAIVSFADGTSELYDFPQMDRLGFFERYRRERYRKWVNDNLRLDKNPQLWRPAAAWVAGLHADRPAPVTLVRLIRRWWDIPAPEAEGFLGRIKPLERREQEYEFYEWRPPRLRGAPR
ncbi:MAG: hypothetical protein HY553_11970 [Elusimicrobia bacterium]|nr:hypothetical protein [Elusimicrobiota bacterium]